MMHTRDYRYRLLALLAGIVLAGTVRGQDAETDTNNTGDAAETAAQAPQSSSGQELEEGPDEEEVDVDDGSYLDADDDDFRPSEEISADRSITFPTDI